MKLLTFLCAIIIASISTPGIVSAENGVSTSESQSITGTQYNGETKELMLENKKKFQEQIAEQKKSIVKEKEEYKAKAEELREKIKIQKQEFKAEAEQKREEFKAKLEVFKNEKKKLAATRVNERLEKINDKRTEQLAKSLERLSELLDKYSSRTAELKLKSIDTAVIDAAITKAKTSISTASDKIEEQAGKEYVAEVVDEATIGKVISGITKSLRDDLKEVTNIIKEVRQAVREAAVIYSKNKSAASPEV